VRKGDEFTRFEYEDWQRVTEKYDAVWSSLTRQFIPHLIDAAQVSTGLSILDVACGPGYVSAAVKKVGPNPTGIDFSKKMIAIASSMFPEIAFREGDAQQLRFADASYDRVLMNFGLSISRLRKKHARKHFASCDRKENLASRSGRSHTKIPGAKL
jgi:ubiquinone/menaquinone biosynthesis C-methylase UbiE